MLISIIKHGTKDEEFIEELIQLGHQDVVRTQGGTAGLDAVCESQGQQK